MPKKSSKNVMPAPLPKGEILTDIAKKKWCLGPSIGKGGFGEIYSAAEYSEGNKKKLNYEYVVKIEPHENGPLFCEMHFFMRNSKPDSIQSWCTEKKISTLGVPRYLGSGSHEHNGNKFRFLVMDKYGKDLWHIFLENKKKFPIHTVFRIALQLIDALEYIHDKGYVHADLKGANILLGATKKTENQAYLVDFGLACKFTQKPYKLDPKKAHNGTIEYTSRDAHDGVPTRRGDLEILAFNLIHWIGCDLPWENCLQDPVAVHTKKKTAMNNVTLFLNNSFGKGNAPGALVDFLKYVAAMSYDTTPDYNKIRAMFTKGLKAAGGSLAGSLEFKTSEKHKPTEENGESESSPEKKRKLSSPRKGKQIKNGNVENDSPTVRTNRRKKKVLEEVSNSESEDDEVEEYVPVKTKKATAGTRGQKRSATNKSSEEEPSPSRKSTNGFTAEMLRLKKQIDDKKAIKIKKTKSNNKKQNIETPRESLSDDVIEDTPPQVLTTRKNLRPHLKS